MRPILYRDFCPELKAHWKALEGESEHHVFQTYEWLEFWQRTIGAGPAGCAPCVVVVLDDRDAPMMLLPLGVTKRLGARVLEFLGGSQADYNGPLVHTGWLSDVAAFETAWATALEALPAHDVRHFAKLPASWTSRDNPLLKVLPTVFQDNSYFCRLPKARDEFLATLRTKLKSDDRRQRRRLSEIGAMTVDKLVADDRCAWNAAMDAMIEQKRYRYRVTGVPDLFSSVAHERFYRELPTDPAACTSVHFTALRLDDRVLATHWGATYRNRFYFLMPSYAAGQWATYSPGRLLLSDLVLWSIDNGIGIFDFTIGGEDYKKDWCNGVMPLFEHLSAVTPAGLIYRGFVRLRRRVRRNERAWNAVKSVYSLVRYGRRREN